MRGIRFTDADVAAIVDILGKSDSVADACRRLRLSPRSLAMVFGRRGMPSPSNYLPGISLATGEAKRVPASVPTTRTVADAAPSCDDPALAKLAGLARSGIGFDELCDRLDLSPARTKDAIAQAQAAGYRVDMSGGIVAWREPDTESSSLRRLGPAPVVGGRHVIAVISDTHLGNKHCMRSELQDFVADAYKRGARQVLHCGDVLDGCYDFARWELSHHGLVDQIADAAVTLPQIDGLEYYAITGNHDETFVRATGLDTGEAIVDRFRRLGREDFHNLGPRGATISVGNVRFELWHPKQRTGRSLEYQLLNRLERYAPGTKPDVLLSGHWHGMVYKPTRGVHALVVPAWLGPRSAFYKSIAATPVFGGLLLSWEQTSDGTLRGLSVEYRAYYYKEHVREIDSRVGVVAI